MSDRAHSPSTAVQARFQASLAGGLRLTGWLTVNLLVSLGVLTLAVLTIGGFSIEGSMRHLANLSARYIAANGGRRDQFDMIVLSAWSVAFGACCLFRQHALQRHFFWSHSHE